jgi:hypothetical protein
MKIKQVIPVLAALAVVVTPVVASAATQTANTTINATINEVISISTSTTVTLNLTPTAGGVVSSSSDTVTVSTNKTNGYNLTLADADATTSLVSGGNTITAHSGTFAAPTALTNGKWGYAVAAAGGFDATYTTETNAGSSATLWAGVPATGSAQTLKTTSSTASGDTTTVWYAAKANSSQPNGVYSDTVTYTATTN